MALQRVDLVVLYCGQGMANVIELYDSSLKVPDVLIICDFGGSQYVKDEVVDYVMLSLGSMQQANIACTIISHQDEDHWSFLPSLTDRIKRINSVVKIGQVYKGGELWGCSASSAVKEFATLSGSEVRSFTSNETSFGDSNAVPVPIYVYESFSMYLILSNLSNVSRGFKNATSAVVMGVIGGNQAFVLPGDSTVLTMDRVNEVVTTFKAGSSGWSWPDIKTLSVPHHGSIRTSANNAEQNDLHTITQFAEVMGAKSVNVSAGWDNQFHHPNINILNVFEPHLSKEWPGHRYTAYVPVKNQWETYPSEQDTTDGIYTTVRTFHPCFGAAIDFVFEVVQVDGVETVVMTPKQFCISAREKPDDLIIAPAPKELL
jgi:beta-lactamase superfamily II metal-dependent hydrolase